MAKLINIASRNGKRSPMKLHQSAIVTFNQGIADDFRGKPGSRQVTILDVDSWMKACREIGKSLDWTARRANLLVSGLNLENSTERIITIGDVLLEVTQETDPCNRMEETEAGLYRALESQWRGGVCCKVIGEGLINVGDGVSIS